MSNGGPPNKWQAVKIDGLKCDQIADALTALRKIADDHDSVLYLYPEIVDGTDGRCILASIYKVK